MGTNIRKRQKIDKHICELRQTSSESTLPKLPPNAKICARLKRKFKKLIIVSEDHPYTKYYLKSKAAIASERKRHSSSKHWWVVHPYSKFRLLWNKIMAITFTYFFITVPYFKFFFRVCGRQLDDHFRFVYPAYAISTIDIFMNFITGYMSTDDGHTIFIDLNSIARHYIRGLFFIDLITSLPYTWFMTIITNDDLMSQTTDDVYFFALIVELIPLLKICRLLTLRHYIKQLNTSSGLTSVTDIIIWLSLLTIFIIHWSACLSWAFPFLVLHATHQKIALSDIYVVRNKLFINNKHDVDSWEIYIMSLHMGVSNLVGSNFIEFREFSFADKVIRCFLLLFGSGYTIYLIVVILQLVESSSKSQLKYQEIMRRVKEYVDENDLPEELGNKLTSYYEYRFQENYFQENMITATFPHHLKQEINLYSNHDLLETAKIFDNLPKRFIADIMDVADPVIYLKNDVIYKSGSQGDCMYFIVSGTIAVITPMGKEVGHLEDGDHFGETCLIQPDYRQREITTIALETSQLLQLNRRHFNRLILPTSVLYLKLSEIVHQRLDELNKLNKIMQDEMIMKKRRSSQYKRLLQTTSDDVNLSV